MAPVVKIGLFSNLLMPLQSLLVESASSGGVLPAGRPLGSILSPSPCNLCFGDLILSKALVIYSILAPISHTSGNSSNWDFPYQGPLGTSGF